MLNPPLALLSEDLVEYLVKHVARLPHANRELRNLSLADPAFTEVCQKHIFHTLTLGKKRGSRSRISSKLKKVKRILDDNPLFANRVRKIQLSIDERENAWLLQTPSSNHPHGKDAVTFINILQLLASSPMPPHELDLQIFLIEDPILVVGRLTRSFFSQTLTILHVSGCENVPLPLFLVCPKLKEVHLDSVEATEGSYNNYPDDQCSGTVLPTLELFNYRDAHTVVKQMITPPPRFRTPVVLWSNLRVLTLSPHEREEMALLRPILDAACNTLEELHLTGLILGLAGQQFPLAGLVNLNGLSRLRVFALYAFITCYPPAPAVLRDINTVLRTIPASNGVTNLSFDFSILGVHPFRGCHNEDWEGICDEVIRISSGKPLELDLQMTADNGKLHRGRGEGQLYRDIMKRMTSLSDHPNICTHFWNPSYWTRGLGPFPSGQVRNRCRR